MSTWLQLALLLLGAFKWITERLDAAERRKALEAMLTRDLEDLLNEKLAATKAVRDAVNARAGAGGLPDGGLRYRD